MFMLKRIVACFLILAMLLPAPVLAQETLQTQGEQEAEEPIKLLDLSFEHSVQEISNPLLLNTSDEIEWSGRESAEAQTPLLKERTENEIEGFSADNAEHALEGNPEPEKINIVYITVKNVCDERLNHDEPAEDVELTVSGGGGVAFASFGKTSSVDGQQTAPEGSALALYENMLNNVVPTWETPASFSEELTLSIGDLAYGASVTMCVAIRITDPERDIVSMKARAETERGDYVEYACDFDVARDAYAILIATSGRGDGEDAAKNNLDYMRSLYTQGYFNGREIEVLPEIYEPEDFWAELEAVVDGFESDENDVVYVYLNAHGISNHEEGAVSLIDGGDTTYRELFEFFEENVAGSIVFLFDNCYSGRAAYLALDMGLDERMHVVAATDKSSNSPLLYNPEFADKGVALLRSAKRQISENTPDAVREGVDRMLNLFYGIGVEDVEQVAELIEKEIADLYYGWGHSTFAKFFYEGALSGAADAGNNDVTSIAEIAAYLMRRGAPDEFAKLVFRLGNIVLAPKSWSSQLDLPVFMSTPEARYVETLEPQNEQYAYGVVDDGVASVIVTVRLNEAADSTMWMQMPEIFVYPLDEEGNICTEISDKINNDLLALYNAAAELSGGVPQMVTESEGDYGLGYYELRLDEVAAVPGDTLHLSFEESHNIDVWMSGETHEFSYIYDLSTGERHDDAAATIDDLLDPENAEARAQLLALIAAGLSEYNLNDDAEDVARDLLAGKCGSWSLTSVGFEGIFDIWEVTSSRDDGRPRVRVPYEKLEGILDEAYIVKNDDEIDGTAYFTARLGSDVTQGIVQRGLRGYGYVTGFGIQAAGCIRELMVTCDTESSRSLDEAIVGYATHLNDAIIWLPLVKNGTYTATWTDAQGEQTAVVTVEDGAYRIGEAE